MALDITIDQSGGDTTIVRLAGTLDTQTAPSLEKRMDPVLRPAPEVIAFDLKDLRFLSSAGLRIMAKAKKALKRSGGALLLVDLQPQVREIFDIVKAVPPENIFGSLQEMEQFLRSRRQSAEGGGASPAGAPGSSERE